MTLVSSAKLGEPDVIASMLAALVSLLGGMAHTDTGHALPGTVVHTDTGHALPGAVLRRPQTGHALPGIIVRPTPAPATGHALPG